MVNKESLIRDNDEDGNLFFGTFVKMVCNRSSFQEMLKSCINGTNGKKGSENWEDLGKCIGHLIATAGIIFK